MKMKMFVIAAGALLVAGCQTPNTREDAQYSKAVPVNGKIDLTFWAHINPDCSSGGPISVSVIEQPQHGQVAVFRGSDFPNFSKGNVRSRCNVRRVPGVQVTYKAQPNYVGSDRASFRVIYADGDQWIRRYQLEIR